MKKTIRMLLASVLVAAIVVSCFSFVASAAGENIKVTIKSDVTEASAGDVVTFTMNISNNYYATNMRWPVLYSKDVFEPVGTECNIAVTDDFDDLGGSVTYNFTPGDAAFTQSAKSEDNNAFLIQWLGISGGQIKTYRQESGMDCFTFQLKVKADAEYDSVGEVFIPADSTLFYKQALTDLETPLTPSKIVSINALAYSFENASVTIPSPVQPELVAVEGSDTVINKSTKTIYGLGERLSNLNAYVTATGSAEVKVTPKVGTKIGTGSTVQLMKNGEVLDTYTVIIYGDVDGDGSISDSDIILVDNYYNYVADLDDNQSMAADVDGSGYADTGDIIIFDLVYNYSGDIDQATGGYVAY